MNSITLQIHSFVDLITNSSSEVFVSANDKTLGAIKKLVDNILAAAGSPLKADDLFEFKALVEDDDSELVDIATPEGAKYWKTHKNSEYSPTLSVKVTAKAAANEAKLAAKVLSSLNSLFDISERYS